ncbi:MAG TPA: M28 family metallopeptidase [Kofleriaceae bacterium]|nr:M28 family metallopeptidase [Kofleriaceae bacterium]
MTAKLGQFGGVRIALVGLVVCALAGAAIAGPAPDRARLEADVRALADDIGPRSRNTAGATRAAGEIERRAAAIGLEVQRYPVGRVRSPEIRVAGRLIMAAGVHQVEDDNLVVEIAGRGIGPAILVMAHYDTVHGTPGAVDNAVGVAVLLELGRLLRDMPPARPVLLAWTASEEHGLAGARALVRDLGDRVGLAIAIDLLGAANAIDLNGLSDRMGAEWLSWLAITARAAGVDVRAPVPQRVVSRLLPAIERSDHGPFTERGVPAFHLYSRGPERIFLDYHAPSDTTERVAWPAVLGGVRLIFAITQRSGELPRAGGDPGMWLDVPGGPRVISWAVLLGIEALLLWIALAGLVLLRRRRARAVDGFGRGLFTNMISLGAGWGVAAIVLSLARRATQHPAPWVHEPARFYAAAIAAAIAIAIAGAWLLAHRLPPAGRARFLAPAILGPAVLGIILVIVAAPELALPCFFLAACFGALALTDRLPAQLALFALTLWPLAAALDPALLREAVYHGFLPATAPLWPALALLTLPHALAAIYLLRSHPIRLPPSRLLLPLAAALLLIAATALAVIPTPRCTRPAFESHGLQCE